MKYIITILFSLTLGITMPAWAADHGGSKDKEKAPFKGKYEIIGPIEALKGIKQIEIMEFFNYSCGHCYRFLETSKKLHTKYKDKLMHKKSPIYWGDQTAFPAMAYYIADEQGVEEKFTQELFDTNFKLNINIFKAKIIQVLAKDFGIEKEMTEGMQSEKIKAKVNKSLELAKQYNASETPTIIINKTLKVTPGISGGSTDLMTDNLDVIFQDLLNQKAE